MISIVSNRRINDYKTIAINISGDQDTLTIPSYKNKGDPIELFLKKQQRVISGVDDGWKYICANGRMDWLDIYIH